MNLNFRNRIAFHYMIATAVIMAVIFGVVYVMVQSTVYRHLDNDLSYEAKKHTKEIGVEGDSIRFINKEEWEEREHREIQVNPVFVQLMDKKGRIMDKSPNLKEDFLPFKDEQFGGHFDASLKEKSIRQAQVPIEQDGQIIGYILAAMSSESSESVILRLRNVLIISYLVVLAGLYFISRFLAGRSIIPIEDMTLTINRITRNNLNERVNLPYHKDELYDLSTGFNQLLQRIENAINRERQFTSDASHELRTPLAALRGTLEVLIRKQRSTEEYETKVKYCLSEIDRMSTIIDQLLLLARLDSQAQTIIANKIPIVTVIDESLSRFATEIDMKNITIEMDTSLKEIALVPQYYSHLILDNIIGNAVKYTKNSTQINIDIKQDDHKIYCTIEDQGIGIRAEDQSQLFDNFFRSESLSHKHIPGNGLGLSIAKKAADAIQAQISVQSEPDLGSKFTIIF